MLSLSPSIFFPFKCFGSSLFRFLFSFFFFSRLFLIFLWRRTMGNGSWLWHWKWKAGDDVAFLKPNIFAAHTCTYVRTSYYVTNRYKEDKSLHSRQKKRENKFLVPKLALSVSLYLSFCKIPFPFWYFSVKTTDWAASLVLLSISIFRSPRGTYIHT